MEIWNLNHFVRHLCKLLKLYSIISSLENAGYSLTINRVVECHLNCKI